MGLTTLGVVAVLSLGLGSPRQGPPDRLYGRVVTAGGEVYEGYLRWDRNEGGWADLLNGSKELPWENIRQAERLDDDYRRRDREHSVRIFGLRISWDEDEDGYPSSASSGIRFGHLRTLEVTGDDRALLTLKSGEEVELEGGSTDIGDELRSLVVEDPRSGQVELRWRDLDSVEFLPVPPGAPAPPAERLWGTLHTRSGMEFTGYVAWDTDEILTSDVLDGNQDGRRHRIPFGDIAAVERAGSSAARVVLTDGEELTLRGTNDVDDGIRGIAISDPALGQVAVDWDDFDDIRFHAAPRDAGGYDTFDGGHPLYGTVETEGGERYTGAIRWDNDEANSWEILDGDDGGVTFDVELGQIRSIRALGSRSAEVTLLDGRTFELEGSNDVNDDNKGIFVTMDDGDTVLIHWRDFREVQFRTP